MCDLKMNDDVKSCEGRVFTWILDQNGFLTSRLYKMEFQ